MSSNTANIANNSNTKKQSSQRRIEASRANGAKSKGPVTDAGKARSSQNARRHGILATHICLNQADEDVFNRILEQYVNRFQPRDQAEYDAVEEIVYYKFQMRQAWMQQASTVAMQMTIDKEFVDATWASPSDIDRRVLALTASIKDGNTIALLQRYSRTLSTQADRAIKSLIELQKQRIPPPPAAPEMAADEPEGAPLLNEPNPEIEQSTETLLTAAVFPYASPAYRVPRVHFPSAQPQAAPRTALHARAA
jgi:hypothetical protein